MPDGIGDDVPGTWSDVEQELESRLGTPSGIDPTFTFYREFPDEWQTFSTQVRLELGDFLEVLQRGPCSPELLAKCETHDHYFGYALECGAVIYWKLEVKGRLITISTPPDKICILAVELDR